jgi:hypothetical protein
MIRTIVALIIFTTLSVFTQVPPEAAEVFEYEIKFWQLADGQVTPDDSVCFEDGDTLIINFEQGNKGLLGDTSAIPTSLTITDSMYSVFLLNDDAAWDSTGQFTGETTANLFIPGDYVVAGRAQDNNGLFSGWSEDDFYIRVKGVSGTLVKLKISIK